MNTPDLFSEQSQGYQPLAERLRPKSLEQLFGQRHLVAPDKPLYLAITQKKLHSMIFWGPPGTGKTTLAQMICHCADAHFIKLSAVLSGVKDIRAAIEQATDVREQQGRMTVLFIDEVHRFNKAQQDAFLPHVENGTIIFIGATTENPSFELNNALLSRARTYVLKPLDDDDLAAVVDRALASDEFLAEPSGISDNARQQLIAAADGDARRLLNLLEIATDLVDGSEIDAGIVRQVIGEGIRRFDKGGEAFYDQISALHKSVRGSAVDAALYWFCRMIDGGVDPLYVARRVVRMASEDIGNADPRALQISLDAWETQERLGSPEGELAIAQAIVYLASAPKSNAVYKAYKQMMDLVRESGSLEVPLHLRNAPTKLMRELDYGKAYRYAHDEPGGYAADEDYFPEALEDTRIYEPVDRGFESKIRQRLEWFRQQDRKYRQEK